MKISPLVRGTYRVPIVSGLALLACSALAAADVIITEINYNPDGDDFAREFIEIKNAGDVQENIGGWRFTRGVLFTFPVGTTLDPGEFIVIAWRKALFDSAYPNATAFGQYANDDAEPDLTKGALDNSDERITLENATGEEVFSVKYWDGKGADVNGDADDFERETWPDSPDGDNYTLVSLDPNDNRDPDDHRNWRPSINLFGSPGADEPLPDPLQPVFINEVRSRDGIFDNDAVELYNPGSEPVDVGQWFVSDNIDNPRKNQIPAGTTVPAGGYLVLQNGVDGFTLSVSSKGERAFLYSAFGVGAAATLTGWVNGLHTEASEDGKTFARFFGEDGREHFIADDPSLGQPNGELATPTVVITEIMYAPGFEEPLVPPVPAPPVYQGIDYIKIQNTSGQSVALYDELRPTDNMSVGGFGVTLPGPQPSLAPGEEAFVVSGTEAAFRAAYGVDPTARVFADPMGGNLSAGGEPIELRLPVTIDGESFSEATNANSRRFYVVLDEVRYNDEDPWPSARENGYSIVKTDPSLPGYQPSSWTRSAVRGGSAYSGDVIYVNEVLAHTDRPQADVIELFNPGTEAVDIGGWFLTDDRTQPNKYTIPAGTTIPAGGFWAVNEDNDNNEDNTPPLPYFGNRFSINSQGDSVYLFSASGGVLTGFAHGSGFRATENGVSLVRHVNSAGVESFPPAEGAPTVQINLLTPFPAGAANRQPRVERAVISELYYDPPEGGVEFIEIFNISGGTLSLFDTTPVALGGNPANNWALDGVTFTFPGVRPTLAPDERVVITPLGTDVAAFRAQYNVPAEVTVIGGADGYGGALDNEGEEIALLRPDKPDPAPGGGVIVPMIQVDSIRYDDQAPWPVVADRSIERIDDTAFGDEPSNWAVSTAAELATPGWAPVAENSYRSWASDQFTPGELAGPGTAAGDDFNGDGYINLLAYAFGYSPKMAVSGDDLPKDATAGGDHLAISFRRQLDAPDLVYRVEVSTDGATWVPNNNQTGALDNSDGTETVTFTDEELLGDLAAKLMRVSVDLVAP